MSKAKVTGIGGIFFKSKDPKALRQWYANNLGFDASEYGSIFKWETPEGVEGQTVWSPFSETTKHFEPSDKPFMLNLRVDDMDTLLAQLKEAGVEQIGEAQAYEYGKFAYIMDPEGNKLELWEPKAE